MEAGNQPVITVPGSARLAQRMTFTGHQCPPYRPPGRDQATATRR